MESPQYTCEVCGYDTQERLTYRERMIKEQMARRMEVQALHNKISTMESILVNLQKMVVAKK